VWAWGSNLHGQLGDGTRDDQLSPVQVQGLGGVIAVAAGTRHSLALTYDGVVWGWGYNGDGELGDGTPISRSTVAPAFALTNVTAIAAGSSHSLALQADGTVWAWAETPLASSVMAPSQFHVAHPYRSLPSLA